MQLFELQEKLTEVLEDSNICEQLMYVYSQEELDSEVLFNCITNLGISMEFVDRYGGEEKGRIYYSVIKFTAGDSSLLVKFSGDYASHYGVDYTHWSFVTPRKVEITEYV